jgi:hypothetical protein
MYMYMCVSMIFALTTGFYDWALVFPAPERDRGYVDLVQTGTGRNISRVMRFLKTRASHSYSTYTNYISPHVFP